MLISPAARVTLLPERSRVPANSSALTPPFLIVTAPELTEKLSLLNDATPLLDVEASSPAIVTVPPDCVASIPSPEANVNVPPRATFDAVEPSVTEIVLLTNLLFAIDPANCELETELIVTAPEFTLKSAAANDAIPITVVEAFLAVTVRVSPDCDVLIGCVCVAAPVFAAPVIVKVSPRSTAFVPVLPAKVIVLFVSLLFAIEPASCVFETPPALIVTAPDVTAKSAAAKDATPLFVAVASSASTVTTLLVTAVLIPSPPVKVRSESRRLTVSVPVSPATEMVVEILTLAAAVKRPWASTAKVGI